MNKTTSNEKYTCVYNESKIVIFDSQMVKMFPPFQGVKFAELDKYRKERIYLFDGSYFIETNFGVDIRFGQGSFEMQRMLR